MHRVFMLLTYIPYGLIYRLITNKIPEWKPLEGQLNKPITQTKFQYLDLKQLKT